MLLKTDQPIRFVVGAHVRVRHGDVVKMCHIIEQIDSHMFLVQTCDTGEKIIMEAR